MNKKVTIGKKNPGGSGFFRSWVARSSYFVVVTLLLLNISNTGLYGQAVKGVGISEDVQITPEASSILELRSVERGFLAPRMTTAQRTGIVSPADGLLVYDTITQSFWYWDQSDTEWKAISALAWGSGNQLLGMNASGDGVEYKTLYGTLNQINVDLTTPGQITLSTPQDIDINATPEFQNIFIDDLLTNSGVYTDNTGWLTSTPPSSGVIGYWDRDGILKILSPSNVGDSITTSGSIYTTGNGSIYTTDNGFIYSATTITSAGNMTSGGLLTSNGGADINGTTTIDGATTVTGNTVINGDTDITGATTVDGSATISGGIVSINEDSNYITNINTGTSTGDVIIGNINNSIYLPEFTIPGVLHNDASGLVSSSLVVNNDLADGTIDLTTKVTGILPVENGGTNSGTALNGYSIMISDGSSIIQGEKGTTTTVLHGDASGAPTYGLVVNDDIASDAVTSDKILDDEIVDADINSNAGINATKIADGTVDNIEFEFLDGVTSSIQIQFADLQTELDVTQTGAGLDTDGTYITNSGTNYIDPATSLADADLILDAQIASSAGDISDLQTEVDQVEAGAGLAADGTYVANSGTNYIDPATSLAEADVLLDTQVGVNEADIAQEILDRGTADAAIQGELDVTQTGAGLDTDGTYITNSGTNYIDPATSLADADLILDAQIASSAGDISDLQTEVDQVEAGAGLAADGTYVANSGTNYIDPATSLAEADVLLDTQVGVNEADIAQEILDRGTADAAIQGELDVTQTGAGLDTDGTYITNSGTNYIDPATSLADADLILDAQIASSAGDISDLQTEVDQVEAGAGLAADGTYVANSGTNYIDPATSLAEADVLLDTQVGVNEADIAQEILDRGTADAAIQGELDVTQTGAGLDTDGTYITNSGTNYIDPATSLADADLILDAQIASSAGDISDLQTEVDQVEAGAGLAADGTYVANSGTNYIDPATSLAEADVLLDTQVGVNEADIAQEILDRGTADAAIQGELDVTQTGAGLDTDGTYITNSGTNYIDPATSLADADLILDAQIEVCVGQARRRVDVVGTGVCYIGSVGVESGPCLGHV